MPISLSYGGWGTTKEIMCQLDMLRIRSLKELYVDCELELFYDNWPVEKICYAGSYHIL